ncbi:MAG: OFA family MFS transporter [Acetivibrionales bacterium]|jgi:OFA family oxalate/formate antiporter-like MFS transporter
MISEKKRWTMLVANVIINICVGVGYAWSVFQTPLIDIFGWSTAEASLAFTLIMGVSAIPMPFVGKLQEYIKPRAIILAGGLLYGICVFLTGYAKSLTALYLSFGILAGLGQGTVYSTGISNMIKLFPDKRGLCSGLLAAGMGSGAVIIAPVAANLINKFGVQDTFKILGVCFTIIICALSALIATAPENFKPEGWNPENKKTNSLDIADKNWRQMLKDPRFYLIAGMFTAGTISGMMIIGHASPLFQETIKVSPQTAAILVGFLSMCNTSGRILWGLISDKIGRFNTILILYIIIGISMFGLAINLGSTAFIIFMMVVGLCYGGFMSLIASLTADSFGPKNLAINFGIMFNAYGLASFIGPRLGAVIQQANNGSFAQAFYFSVFICIAGMILTIGAMVKSKTGSVKAV